MAELRSCAAPREAGRIQLWVHSSRLVCSGESQISGPVREREKWHCAPMSAAACRNIDVSRNPGFAPRLNGGLIRAKGRFLPASSGALRGRVARGRDCQSSGRLRRRRDRYRRCGADQSGEPGPDLPRHRGRPSGTRGGARGRSTREPSRARLPSNRSEIGPELRGRHFGRGSPRFLEHQGMAVGFGEAFDFVPALRKPGADRTHGSGANRGIAALTRDIEQQ